MRTRAYRRAQQDRMISKAMKIVGADDWIWRKLVDNEWVDVKVYDPRTEAKKRANNLAACSCWMCTSHKRRPTRELSITELKSDASARQQLEDVAYG